MNNRYCQTCANAVISYTKRGSNRDRVPVYNCTVKLIVDKEEAIKGNCRFWKNILEKE
jgi:hypothetical protein